MQPADRLHALDAVRAYALLLGVVLHGAAAFLEGFPIPMWLDTPSDGAPIIYYVIHMFRMSAFFLIAGFFARVLVERRGVKAFVKDRAKRVALPLVLFSIVVALTSAVGFVLGALPHGVDYLMSLVQTAQPQPGAAAPAPQAARLGRLQPRASLVPLLPADLLCADARDSLARACRRSARRARGRLRPRRRVRDARRVGARADRAADRGVPLAARQLDRVARPAGAVPHHPEHDGADRLRDGVRARLAAEPPGASAARSAEDLVRLFRARRGLDDLLPHDDRHDAALGGRQPRRHGSPALHGCVRRRPMVLGVRVRRRRRAVSCRRRTP